MNKALEQKLVERWPKWFNTEGDVRQTLMPSGFLHGDGWFDILWRLREDLEPLVTEFEQEAGGPNFEVLEVKEKFGGLRFYVNCRNDAIRQPSFSPKRGPSIPARFAASRANCGKDSWIKTLCDEHASAHGVNDHD